MTREYLRGGIKTIYRWHAKKRCNEKFGVDLTNKEIQRIVSDIQNGRAEYLWSTSKYRHAFRVKFMDFTIKVIYSKKKKTIITVLEDWEYMEEKEKEKELDEKCN
jgi:hypothetical protein